MKKNILFALAVILLAGVIAVTRVMTRTEGTTARVEITDATISARATAGFQKSTTRPSVCPRALWYRWKKAPDGHPARRRGNVQFL